MKDPSREAFERWMQTLGITGLPLSKENNKYWFPNVQLAWEAWCAVQEHLRKSQQDEPSTFKSPSKDLREGGKSAKNPTPNSGQNQEG